MSASQRKRDQNERKYGDWHELPDGGRRYWYDVAGRHGWKARYVKEVDLLEQTTRFYQEIYNSQDLLVEVHEKYPIDRGHHPAGDTSHDDYTEPDS